MAKQIKEDVTILHGCDTYQFKAGDGIAGAPAEVIANLERNGLIIDKKKEAPNAQ